jgi:hypothetical protein
MVIAMFSGTVAGAIAALVGRAGTASMTTQLDRYDWQILRILQDNGSISNQDLADSIGLSPSPCLRRVRILEEAGFITGYRALLAIISQTGNSARYCLSWLAPAFLLAPAHPD